MSTRRTILIFISTALAAALLALSAAPADAQPLQPAETLGKMIFFDESLSINNNESCAFCHAPGAGWTGPDPVINGMGAVYEGSILGRFGNRKPPSAAYATQSPILHFAKQGGGLFIGGNFWDGRATGERLGSPSAEQALGPFLNPLEQALFEPADVIGRICTGGYAGLFLEVCGAAACDSINVGTSYDCVGLSVAAYESSPEVNQFTSKYDAVVAGTAQFTKQEQAGFNLFWGKGKCNKCHTVNPRGKPALFTDYTYDNLGVPKNPLNPFYTMYEFNPLGPDWIDQGLGGFLAGQMDHPEWLPLAPAHYGMQKVPTLRNVDRWDPALGMQVKAYGHNGYFKSLKGIVHFYNTRDVLATCPGPATEAEALAANCWPPPEVAMNVNTRELGDLGLSEEEEWQLVEFMRTLSDGFVP